MRSYKDCVLVFTLIPPAVGWRDLDTYGVTNLDTFYENLISRHKYIISSHICATKQKPTLVSLWSFVRAYPTPIHQTFTFFIPHSGEKKWQTLWIKYYRNTSAAFKENPTHVGVRCVPCNGHRKNISSSSRIINENITGSDSFPFGCIQVEEYTANTYYYVTSYVPIQIPIFLFSSEVISN